MGNGPQSGDDPANTIIQTISRHDRRREFSPLHPLMTALPLMRFSLAAGYPGASASSADADRLRAASIYKNSHDSAFFAGDPGFNHLPLRSFPPGPEPGVPLLVAYGTFLVGFRQLVCEGTLGLPAASLRCGEAPIRPNPGALNEVPGRAGNCCEGFPALLLLDKKANE